MGIVVNLEGNRDHRPSLDELGNLVAEDLKAVNALIVQHMDSPVHHLRADEVLDLQGSVSISMVVKTYLEPI